VPFKIICAHVFAVTGTVISVVFGSAAGVQAPADIPEIVVILQRDAVYIASGIVVAAFLLLNLFLRWTTRRGTKRSHLEMKFECFARALLGGLFSGTTGFVTKSVVSCIGHMFTTHDTSDLKRIEFYAFLFSLPLSLMMQLYYLNSGLKRFDAMEMVPPYQSSIVIIGVAWGWTFFK
jgi:hypothetical protein